MIYFSEYEKEAIEKIDENNLENLIEKSIEKENSSYLSCLNLHLCGSYVSEKYNSFIKDLGVYSKYKSYSKKQEARMDAVRSGDRLLSSVINAKNLLVEENLEKEKFIVKSAVSFEGLFKFSRTVSRTISSVVEYSWLDEDKKIWQNKKIRFYYKYRDKLDLNPGNLSKRKINSVIIDNIRNAEERLIEMSLHTIRDYLKKGGDPNKIPEEFEAKLNSGQYHLNNFSLDFWRY